VCCPVCPGTWGCLDFQVYPLPSKVLMEPELLGLFLIGLRS
jgi:hypothetical protein